MFMAYFKSHNSSKHNILLGILRILRFFYIQFVLLIEIKYNNIIKFKYYFIFI